MDQQLEKIVDKAIKDPEKLYKTPDAVLNDTRLTQAEKNEILHSWELDQLALLRAEEENMIQKTDVPPATDLLKKLKIAEKMLEKAQ